MKYFFTLGFMLFGLTGFAQKEGNVWCFPDTCGIDFNNSSPTVFTSKIGPQGLGIPSANQTSIADTSGNLFCYAAATDYSFSGMYVFDRNHNIMPNGGRLQGSPVYNSLLLPHPGKDSLICLLHFGRDSVNSNYFPLFYSVIDKNENNGYGAVVLRDSLIYYAKISVDKFAAVRHGNGRDWWIFTQVYDNSYYLKFLLTPQGISYAGNQLIGSNGGDIYYGKMLFSNDGTRLLSVGATGCVDIYDFDRCTGVLSNFLDVGEHLVGQEYEYYNAAFSPNGSKIYVSTWDLRKVFYQWDLDATNVPASKTLIHEYLDTGIVQWNQYWSHLLAPNGKIYIPKCNHYGLNSYSIYNSHLDVIEYPDSAGTACQYIVNGFSLGNHFVQGALPNVPYYGLGRMIGSTCDTLTAVADIEESQSGVDVYPNPTKDVFFIRLIDPADRIKKVILRNVLGEEVYSENNCESSIDLSFAAPGVYFLQAETVRKQIFTGKIIKQ